MKKLTKLFLSLFFIIFLSLLLLCKEKYTIILGIIPFFIFFFLSKKIPNKYFPYFLFFFSLFIRLVMLLIYDSPISDDFKTMYDASHSLINDDLSFKNDFYFEHFGYQLGHSLYQALLLSICNKVIFLKIVNSIITSFCVVFIYFIAKKVSSINSAKIVSLLYMIYFYPIYLNTILTNQHLPLLISLIVIYLIIDKKIIKNSLLKSIIIGFLLAISNILRSEAIIYILAIIVVDLCFTSKKEMKKTGKNLFVLIAVYLVVFHLASFSIKLANLSSIGLENKSPLWKFYVGLNPQYDGMYNLKDQEEFFKQDNERYQKQLLKNRIQKEYQHFPILWIKKEMILWTYSDWNIVLKNKKVENSITHQIYLKVSRGILILVFFFLMISCFPKNKELEKNEFLLISILFIYFCVYSLIEVSPRYSYNLQLFIFILSSIGIDRVKSSKVRFFSFNKR